jgi:hypothetical protein
MWTYNVIRDIFISGKFSVLPKLIPPNEADLIKNALASEVKEREVYCIKTHGKLINPLPTTHEVKVICNHRDVRDACLSYMRFIHCDFEQGLKAVHSMMDITDYYLKIFDKNILPVRYEDINQSPKQLIDQLCQYLEVDVSDAKKNEILSRYSRENIKKKLKEMSDVRLDEHGKVKGTKNQSKFESVKNLDGTYRAYDKNTAFQSNHITAKKDGEWKTAYTFIEVEQINALCGSWLIKHGYQV